MACLQGLLASLLCLESCLHKNSSDFQLSGEGDPELSSLNLRFSCLCLMRRFCQTALREAVELLHFCGLFHVLEKLLYQFLGKCSPHCLD